MRVEINNLTGYVVKTKINEIGNNTISGNKTEESTCNINRN